MFCSEVVGMLREKDLMIAQLRDVALQTAGARAKGLRARRLEEQEDLIYRAREVGWSQLQYKRHTVVANICLSGHVGLCVLDSNYFIYLHLTSDFYLLCLALLCLAMPCPVTSCLVLLHHNVHICT